MKTRIFLLSLGIILCSYMRTSAQPALNTNNYKTAIGLRGGIPTSGLTVKHFLGGGSSALEGIIGFWRGATSITVLYEKHVNAGAPGLNWYYGGGGHVAFATGRYYAGRYGGYYYRDDYYNGNYYYRNSGVGLGIDGMVGIEYKINPIPFAISFDLKPFLEINTAGGAFVAIDPGIGLKFTF